MLERGKMERGMVELVDTERLAPEEHRLRKVDKAVGFRELYEMVGLYPIILTPCTRSLGLSSPSKSGISSFAA